ncbi:MAG: SH3 domain-containing protein [Clostridiales bacterium]
MKKKLVIVLSLFLMFLSVSYIAYYITSNTVQSDNYSSSDDSEKIDSSSSTMDSSLDVTNDGNSNTPENTDELATTPTNSPEATSINSENEVIFDGGKEGIVKSAVFTHPIPETNSENLRTLKKDEKVNIVSEFKGWYKLDDNSYVYSSFINIAN